MFATLQNYIIIGLAVLLFTVGGAFYLNNKANTARIEGLVKEVSTYTLANEVQKKTIEELVADAEKQAKANKELSERMMLSEKEFVDEWAAINALDLASSEALKDVGELERKVNAEFNRSIESLKAVSGNGSCPDPNSVCK